ncbi:hypothetical protein BVX98_06770 [bacterium F11]|nr:hypothetical protein BVX98_06770 [bacterium F11]
MGHIRFMTKYVWVWKVILIVSLVLMWGVIVTSMSGAQETRKPGFMAITFHDWEPDQNELRFQNEKTEKGDYKIHNMLPGSQTKHNPPTTRRVYKKRKSKVLTYDQIRESIREEAWATFNQP